MTLPLLQCLNRKNNMRFFDRESRSGRSALWLAIILFLLSFGLGVLVGNVWGIRKQITSDDGNIEIVKVLNLYAKSRSDSVDFNQFWDLWNLVKEKYVAQPVDDVKLFYGAMQGLVSGLEDPYSAFFPPKKAEEFAKDLSGEFEGIGAEIGMQKNQLTIIAPLPSSPAEKAGLKAGDKIYAIDGKETFNLSLDEAISAIRGPKGTQVKLTISHDGLEEVEEITVTRDVIVVPTVIWEMKEDKFAYLRISYFNEKTGIEFDKAVKKIQAKNPQGIILDLRGNPGGYLETAVSVASEWVKNGLIVKEKSSQGEGGKYYSVGKHNFVGFPTVVLVDGGSASGSEIVAGALQDYKLAKIVGQKTYGKGSVQDFEVLSDGSALKLTIARWHTPNDRQIEGDGIQPDIVLDKMFEEIKKWFVGKLKIRR